MNRKQMIKLLIEEILWIDSEVLEPVIESMLYCCQNKSDKDFLHQVIDDIYELNDDINDNESIYRTYRGDEEE